MRNAPDELFAAFQRTGDAATLGQVSEKLTLVDMPDQHSRVEQEIIVVADRVVVRTDRPHHDTALMPLLAEVGLGDSRDCVVAGFSAGMKKRLALLRIRLKDPQVVLLDEPFAALDADGGYLLEGWVRRYLRAGKTLVMASHAVERAARLCDRALLLRHGQVAWRGPAAELTARMEASAWAA